MKNGQKTSRIIMYQHIMHEQSPVAVESTAQCPALPQHIKSPIWEAQVDISSLARYESDIDKLNNISNIYVQTLGLLVLHLDIMNHVDK